MSEAVLVLKSGRCEWGKCLFCGYGRIQGDNPSSGVFQKKIDDFIQNLDINVKQIKVFGSGSFFDEKQVSATNRNYFINKCLDAGIVKVTVESRPRYITAEKIRDFKGLKLEIAIGLEVASDEMLDKINKGFHLIDFKKAASLIHEEGALLRSYLLVNLPYVIDLEKNLSDSIDYALRYSDSIVLINLLPHGHTPLFRMWLSGEWSFLSKKEFHNITDKYASHPKIELDEQTFRFTPLFPDELKTNLKGVGENYLTHPHFEVWQDYLLRWYTPPINKKILLFLPCSYKKPYSISATHKGIIGLTKKYPWIHEVMLSNAGVVPREYENHYPFNSYDWDERGETPEIKNRYIEVTSERIRNYLQAHINHYRRILCFLRDDSESLKALDKACGDTGYDYHNLLTPGLSPQSQEALNELKRGLSDETSQI